MVPQTSERDELYHELYECLHRLREYADTPENRARRLSLAVTNVEQGVLWFRDHIIHDPLPGESI